jgi:hypothetical protein
MFSFSTFLHQNAILTVTQGADGSRKPSAKELELAEIQGKMFYETVAKST